MDFNSQCDRSYLSPLANQHGGGGVLLAYPWVGVPLGLEPKPADPVANDLITRIIPYHKIIYKMSYPDPVGNGIGLLGKVCSASAPKGGENRGLSQTVVNALCYIANNGH